VSRSSARTKPHERSHEAGRPPAKGMVRVPGDTFLMGSNGFYPEERPVHHVSVDGFWMDEAAGD
jgi:formylglycine-generating enzyme